MREIFVYMHKKALLDKGRNVQVGVKEEGVGAFVPVFEFKTSRWGKTMKYPTRP